MRSEKWSKDQQKTLKRDLTFPATPARVGSPISLLDMNALRIALQQLYLASIPEKISVNYCHERKMEKKAWQLKA